MSANQNDEMIRAVARGEAEIKALTEIVRELKHAIEELVDRVDADIDTLRSKSEGFAVVSSTVDDLRRRMTVVETKVEAQGIDLAKLETKLDNAIIDKTKIETKLEAVHSRVLMFSGAAGIIAWVAGKLFK